MLFLEKPILSVVMRRTLRRVVGFLILWIAIELLVNRPFQHLSSHLSSRCSSNSVVIHIEYVESELHATLEIAEGTTTIPTEPTAETVLQKKQQEYIEVESNATVLSPQGRFKSNGIRNALTKDLQEDGATEEEVITTLPPSAARLTNPTTQLLRTQHFNTKGCGNEQNPCDVIMTLSAECSIVHSFLYSYRSTRYQGN